MLTETRLNKLAISVMIVFFGQLTAEAKQPVLRRELVPSGIQVQKVAATETAAKKKNGVNAMNARRDVE